MLGVLVGKVLEFLWKSDTGKRVRHQSAGVCDVCYCSRAQCTTSLQVCYISQADTTVHTDVRLEHVLLSIIDRFGVKVALSVNRNRLLHCGTNGGIHIVRWQSSSDGAEARHRHLEKLWVIFLHGEGEKATD